jgi:Tol biopolymer transport system component
MPDLDERFHGVDLVPVPEQWDDIERRPQSHVVSPRSRIAAGAVGILVAAAIAVAVVGLSHLHEGQPAGSVHPRPNGDLVISKARCGTGPAGMCEFRLLRVDPRTGASRSFPGLDGLSVELPVFSPDGKMIAFVGSKARLFGIALAPRALYVMHTDGSGLQEVASCSGRTDGSFCDPSEMAWSPDDVHLAWVRDLNNGSGGVVLQSVDVVSGQIINLCTSQRSLSSQTRCGDISQPVWSPDGKMVAFSNLNIIQMAGPFRLQGSIWVVNADGTGLRKLTSGLGSCRAVNSAPFGAGCLFDTDPSWAPDSTRIAFGRYEMASGQTKLMVVDAKAGGLDTLAGCGAKDCSQRLQPTWSPDGSGIAFVMQPDVSAIDIVDPASHSLRTIRTCVATQCHVPTGFVWSPDARFLAVEVVDHIGDNVYSVSADGSRFRLVIPNVSSFVGWPAASIRAPSSR